MRKRERERSVLGVRLLAEGELGSAYLYGRQGVEWGPLIDPRGVGEGVIEITDHCRLSSPDAVICWESNDWNEGS